jgi:hypothetical protein
LDAGFPLRPLAHVHLRCASICLQSEAPNGLHTLAFLGGLLLLVSSILNFVFNVMKLG